MKTDKLNNAFDDLEQKFFDLRTELEQGNFGGETPDMDENGTSNGMDMGSVHEMASALEADPIETEMSKRSVPKQEATPLQNSRLTNIKIDQD